MRKLTHVAFRSFTTIAARNPLCFSIVKVVKA